MSATYESIPGIYTPPVSPLVRVAIVHNHPLFPMEKMGTLIGKKGKFLKEITESRGIAYLWFDQTANWFEIWSFSEDATQLATTFLQNHILSNTRKWLAPEQVSMMEQPYQHLRIAVVPNYPGLSNETMSNQILPFLPGLYNTIHGIRYVYYHPWRNWYEIWSENPVATQLAMDALHQMLECWSFPPQPIQPPRLYFARTLDTHDFEDMRQGLPVLLSRTY